jgi:cytoskeleton protein RodZ
MNRKVVAVEGTQEVDELCENIEVVGPGLILKEARKKLSLTTEEVTNKLNFRNNLVNEIENDIFDASLPATFNRGYLRNYAKLVAVDIDEVLSAYEMLSVAEVQRSEMQSFSNLTEKQAEHSRLMWFSYLIAALLFGMMVLWWLQEPTLSANLFDNSNQTEVQEVSDDVNDKVEMNLVNQSVAEPELPTVEVIEEDKILEKSDAAQSFENEPTVLPPTVNTKSIDTVIDDQSLVKTETKPILNDSTVVFTFSGDCWVNIYDATGERIAWGVKKSGYIMTVIGKAPLKVTLGKPELATIIYNGKPVNMSSFNAGNIAKFTLPLIS